MLLVPVLKYQTPMCLSPQKIFLTTDVSYMIIPGLLLLFCSLYCQDVSSSGSSARFNHLITFVDLFKSISLVAKM